MNFKSYSPRNDKSLIYALTNDYNAVMEKPIKCIKANLKLCVDTIIQGFGLGDYDFLCILSFLCEMHITQMATWKVSKKSREKIRSILYFSFSFWGKDFADCMASEVKKTLESKNSTMESGANDLLALRKVQEYFDTRLN